MSNIKTTQKHTITVTATELKKNLCNSYLHMLRDEVNSTSPDFEYFNMDLNRLQDVLQSIEKNGFGDTFRDGHTMVLLNPKDFEYVENWFNKPGSAGEELVVRIVNDAGNQIEIVQHVDLSY